MCLSAVNKGRSSLKNIKEKLAWKVFSMTWRGTKRVLCGKHFPIPNLRTNKWLKATGGDDDASLIRYERGFHSFPDLSSAYSYTGSGDTIRAVKVKHFLATGLQSYYGTCYVTRYMKVLSAQETRRLKAKAKG